MRYKKSGRKIGPHVSNQESRVFRFTRGSGLPLNGGKRNFKRKIIKVFTGEQFLWIPEFPKEVRILSDNNRAAFQKYKRIFVQWPDYHTKCSSGNPEN